MEEAECDYCEYYYNTLRCMCAAAGVDSYYSGTGELQSDDSYTNYLNG